MNREIKFRGKRIDNGEWVYGYYVSDPETTLMPYAIYSERKFHKVIPETVGQFTGLKDKNGNDIYGGSILKDLLSGAVWLVKFGVCKKFAFTGWFCQGINVDRESSLNPDSDETYSNSQVEIIGNTTDNPELIK